MNAARILRLAAGGDGVGRLEDGRAVFVPRTAGGDLAELTDIHEHKRFVRARLARLLESGPGRVEPRCPHYVQDACGGCQLQHLDDDTQRAARRGFVGDALRRLAKRDVTDPELVPSPLSYNYRTKITLAASKDGRRIGLRPYGRPDRVFDLEWCHITVPVLMRLWQVLRTLRPILPAALEQVILRLDRNGGRHVIFKVRGSRAWSGAVRLDLELKRHGSPATIWWQPEGGAARALAGADEPFPATVFEQVHPAMGDRVREFAIQALGPVAGKTVWDLYAGVGETTALLVQRGAQVESVELDRRAVQLAETRGPPARRHTGRVEGMLPELTPPHLVITNPPRTGMDLRVAEAIERLAPARVVYISCDSATLARDLSRLPTYRIAGLCAFDLFPQTAHVETVALLEWAS
jgi:23S rRNA (uracil1939-C5)-methyltransferase